MRINIHEQQEFEHLSTKHDIQKLMCFTLKMIVSSQKNAVIIYSPSRRSTLI